MHKKTGGKEMEIIGKLKENVEKAENKEEAKEIIRNAGEEAGMELSEEELDKGSRWEKHCKGLDTHEY